jgi:hypothetical protein
MIIWDGLVLSLIHLLLLLLLIEETRPSTGQETATFGEGVDTVL